MGELVVTANDLKGVLRLQGDWRVEQASEFKEGLSKAFGEFESFDIDMTELTSMDLSIVQVLCAAGVEAKRQGMDMHLIGLSQESSTRLAAYGLLPRMQEVFSKGERCR